MPLITSSFKTRARTIDHLGREQIADCPTAISELWKNAYDADADEVALHILDGEQSVAAIVDNGFGMSATDFEEKWLTVGTDSKIESEVDNSTPTRKYDRQKQGQKGIGRLSCAALGHLLLIVSKQQGSPYVASVIDWRIFENPYIMLHDISIPVSEVRSIEELHSEIPLLHRSLLENVVPKAGDDSARAIRLSDAWKMFTEYEKQELQKQNGSLADFVSTKELIISQADQALFTERVLRTWQVTTGESETGTAMFMVGIPDDLEDQLVVEAITEVDDATARAKLKLLETLSNFTDPFVKENEKDKRKNKFDTIVIAWNGQLRRELVGSNREFDITNLEKIEHLVDGHVDEEGYFRGRVKAFGKEFENVTIKPSRSYRTRSDSRFGAFDIRIGGYEGTKSKSSMPERLWDDFDAKSDLFGGLRIYRDGLRVMPYGRDDSDFFEIEKRRTKNAGHYFWSSRKTFGRISISRLGNPNLKDKAGREGLLDNRAAMLFREIMINILVSTAVQYFGRSSEIRADALADIEANKAEEKAKEDKKKLLKRERARIKKAIKDNQPELSALLLELEDVQQDLVNSEEISCLQQAKELKDLSNRYNEYIKKFSLSPIPPTLSTVKENYDIYRSIELRAREIIRQLTASADAAIGKFATKSDTDIARSQFNSNRGYITARIRKLAQEGRELLTSELDRFNQLVEERNKAYDAALKEILEDLDLGKVNPADAMKEIDKEYQLQEIANEQMLKPYISALSNIREAIDLEGLAISSMKDASNWQQEAGRLNSLAQLGITVEIIGHEIEGLDITMARGIKQLKATKLDDIQTDFVDSIDYAHQSLSDKWRFLTPLKLSGDHSKTEVTGESVLDYVNQFYSDKLTSRNIKLIATDSFKNFSIYDSPARLYPVFINLINNSRYWLNTTSEESKIILLDYRDNEVIVADDGPGVDLVDIESLFTLFFTKKQRGGRGVGLYLCKSNLALSGHSIRYVTNQDEKCLSGANFAIRFGGLK
ncbi:signal transduction protein [Vibrio paracholerae]|uniref:Signal transduction protein n=3 Tax=Vibrio paracholerae TaxID=650003 RepID=A0ABX9FHE4_9VIBR|nr:sensor histidine kinase [Vibrio paracholerae]RBM51211.1 signal transduction protein [Vibrio paracholerae]